MRTESCPQVRGQRRSFSGMDLRGQTETCEGVGTDGRPHPLSTGACMMVHEWSGLFILRQSIWVVSQKYKLLSHNN